MNYNRPGARDPAGDRVVLPSVADGDPRILIARFDSTTGALTWDETFAIRGRGGSA